MMKYTRRNAYNNGGTFDNPDLYWYALGVREMQKRSLDDKSSWWFFAAIHGENISGRRGVDYWPAIQAPPAVPIEPLPDTSTQNKFWNQCQHKTWFFVPWHRGYLKALEDHIRDAVISLGGPEDWALPYWNYLNEEQTTMPPAFAERELPDGSPNPLYVETRDSYSVAGSVSDACQSEKIYTGVETQSIHDPEYGGFSTNFWHGGGHNLQFGKLESNPHNNVHVVVGGLMGYPDSAALDPIFYIHHCNIDRMWAEWNAMGNANPTDPHWLDRPDAGTPDNRDFVMPLPDGTDWVYTPGDLSSTTQLNYVYEEIRSRNIVQKVNPIAQRLNKLRVKGIDLTESIQLPSKLKSTSELVGASDNELSVEKSGLQATVNIDSNSWKNIPKSFLKISKSNIPDKVYLRLENITGNMDNNMLKVSVNEQHVESLALFGLSESTDKDKHHSGQGLTFSIDITDIIDDLHLGDALDIDKLNVNVSLLRELGEASQISVGRISLYRSQLKG